MKKLFVLLLCLSAFAGQSEDPYKDAYPPRAQTEIVSEKVRGRRIVFRYFSDVEDRRSGYPSLQNFVENLRESEALPFKWPAANLIAPTSSPLGPGDSKKNSHDVEDYGLEQQAPIYYGQGSVEHQASAYVARTGKQQSLAFPGLPRQAAEAGDGAVLESVYEENRLGPSKLPFRVTVSSSHTGTVVKIRVEGQMGGSSSFQLGFALSQTNAYLARSLEIPIQTSQLSRWVKFDDQLFRRESYNDIALMTACGNCVITLQSRSNAWDVVSVPMFVQFREQGFAVGLASVYLPSSLK
jgi:hypothetical protein